jgi:SAM-dependent methyltransferase
MYGRLFADLVDVPATSGFAGRKAGEGAADWGRVESFRDGTMISARGREAMTRKQPYTAEFFERRTQGSLRSAELVMGHLLQLISFRSVIDVGCGTGTWLRAAGMHGVSDFLGIDGDYIDRAALQVPNDRFLSADLTMPLKLDRTFDLAMSLEVAEHLPPACACDFVQSLVGLAPLILFSAAIPFQGGNHHVNEQWPSYWADLFKAHGYTPVDCLRRYIWDDPRVDWWYSQNIFVYTNQEALSRNPALAEIHHAWPLSNLSIVHPNNYLRFVDPLAAGSLKRALALTVGTAKNVLRRRLANDSGHRARHK